MCGLDVLTCSSDHCDAENSLLSIIGCNQASHCFCPAELCGMSSALGAAKQARQSCSFFSRVLSNKLASTSKCGLNIENPQESFITEAQESCAAFLQRKDIQSPLLMGRGDIRTKKGKVCGQMSSLPIWVSAVHHDFLFARV